MSVRFTPGRLTYLRKMPSGFSGFGWHSPVCASQISPTSGSICTSCSGFTVEYSASPALHHGETRTPLVYNG